MNQYVGQQLVLVSRPLNLEEHQHQNQDCEKALSSTRHRYSAAALFRGKFQRFSMQEMPVRTAISATSGTAAGSVRVDP